MISEEVDYQRPTADAGVVKKADVVKRQGALSECAKRHQAHAFLIMYAYAGLVKEGGKARLRGLEGFKGAGEEVQGALAA